MSQSCTIAFGSRAPIAERSQYRHLEPRRPDNADSERTGAVMALKAGLVFLIAYFGLMVAIVLPVDRKRCAEETPLSLALYPYGARLGLTGCSLRDQSGYPAEMGPL
jgi:hypothetical protein